MRETMIISELQEAYQHAARANDVFANQPRETGTMPEDDAPGIRLHWLGAALLVGGLLWMLLARGAWMWWGR